MSRSAVELDFFRMEKESSSKKFIDRRRSFRDIQSVISKLNPQLLKTVIASGSVDHTYNNVAKSSENCNLFLSSKASFSVPSTPQHEDTLVFSPALPLYSPAFGSNASGSEPTPETTPMTIFYNGSVTVFDVPRHKAENIFKLAKKQVSKTVESAADPKLALSSTDKTQILDNINGDLPIARRKSLQRFMEKRKERLTFVSPYGCPNDYASWGQNTSGQRE